MRRLIRVRRVILATAGVLLAAGSVALRVAAPAHAAGNTGRVVRGDFNGDGYADLAIDASNANGGAGAVIVLYGSASGLTTRGSQYWTLGMRRLAGPQNGVPGDGFGTALATGDFNHSGYADLAIGVPGRNGVLVIYGSRTGLQSAGSQWLRGRGPLSGSALAAGDLNDDGYDDLAVGAPFAAVGGAAGAGVVEVHYGSRVGLSAVAPGAAQRFSEATPGMPGRTTPNVNDGFGASLAIGHFRGERFADLAIGVPNRAGVGAVDVLYGSSEGATADGGQYLQSIYRLGSGGFSLAVGDFKGNGFDDLAIGSPNANVAFGATGAIEIHYGSRTGLGNVSPGSAQTFAELSPGMPGPPVTADDTFGYTMSAGDFNADGIDDLAVGVPGKSSAIILYGAPRGVTTHRSQFLRGVGPEASGTVPQVALAVSAGDYDGGRFSDLVIGEPFADNTQPGDGVIEEHLGSAIGLTGVPQGTAPLFSESTAGMPCPSPQAQDNFGIAVAAAGRSR